MATKKRETQAQKIARLEAENQSQAEKIAALETTGQRSKPVGVKVKEGEEAGEYDSYRLERVLENTTGKGKNPECLYTVKPDGYMDYQCFMRWRKGKGGKHYPIVGMGGRTKAEIMQQVKYFSSKDFKADVKAMLEAQERVIAEMEYSSQLREGWL